jgi:WD40 repeat protein
LQLRDQSLYLAQNDGQPGPEVGDLRITFAVVKPTTVSVLGRQVKDSFETYTTSNGTTVFRLATGEKSAKDMFETLAAENTATTWGLRFVGLVLMVLGIALCFQPIAAVADFIPFLGNIVAGGVMTVAVGSGFVLTLCTIAVAWITYRPIVAIPLLCLAAASVYGMRRLAIARRGDREGEDDRPRKRKRDRDRDRPSEVEGGLVVPRPGSAAAVQRVHPALPVAAVRAVEAPATVDIKCPECSATYTVPPKVLGKKTHCKKCQATFVITAPPEEPGVEILPEEEDVGLELVADQSSPGFQPGPAPARAPENEPRPESKRRKKRAEQSSVLMRVLAIAGAVFVTLVLVCAGVIWSLLPSGSKTEPSASNSGQASVRSTSPTPAPNTPVRTREALFKKADPQPNPRVAQVTPPPSREDARPHFDLRTCEKSRLPVILHNGDAGARPGNPSIAAMALSADGATLATAGTSVKVWDLVSGKVHPAFREGKASWGDCLAFSPDGQRLAAGCESKPSKVIVFDVASGNTVMESEEKVDTFSVLALSPDGKTLAHGHAFEPCGVQTWEVESGKRIHFYQGGGSGKGLSCLTFSPHGQTFATGDSLGTDVRYLVRPKGTLFDVARRVGCNDAQCLAFSADGVRLATGCHDGLLLLVVDADGNLRGFQGHTRPMASAAFSADGRWLASVSDDCTTILWDVNSGKELGRLTGRDDEPQGRWLRVAFTKDDELIIANGNGFGSKVFSYRIDLTRVPGYQGKGPARSPETPGPDRTAVTNNPHPEKIPGDQSPKASPAPQAEPRAPAAPAKSSPFDAIPPKTAPATKAEAAAPPRAGVKNGPRPEKMREESPKGSPPTQSLVRAGVETLPSFEFRDHTLEKIRFSLDGKLVAIAARSSSGATVKVREAQTGKELATSVQDKATAKDVAFSPDNEILAIAGDDLQRRGQQPGTLKYLELSTGKIAVTDDSTMKSPSRLCFGPSGEFVATVEIDGTVTLWDAVKRTSAARFPDPDGSKFAVAFSGDGTLLAAAGRGGNVRLINVGEKTQRPNLKGKDSDGRSTCYQFGRDGKTLAVGTATGAVYLWDVATGERLAGRTALRDGSITSLSFSLAGDVLAIANDKGHVAIWKPGGGDPEEILPPDGARHETVCEVQFLPDGKLLVAAGGQNSEVKLCRIDPAAVKAGSKNDVEPAKDGSKDN